MNGALKRLFVAGSAVATLSTALLLSGGASQAQAKPYVTNDVVVNGNVIGRDPDLGIRQQIMKDFDSLHAN